MREYVLVKQDKFPYLRERKTGEGKKNPQQFSSRDLGIHVELLPSFVREFPSLSFCHLLVVHTLACLILEQICFILIQERFGGKYSIYIHLYYFGAVLLVMFNYLFKDCFSFFFNSAFRGIHEYKIQKRRKTMKAKACAIKRQQAQTF